MVAGAALGAGVAALESRSGRCSAMRWSMLAIAGLAARLAELAAAAAPAGQALRQVSILFLDVVGSTTLTQRLDPEETHAVIDGALARFTAIVAAHRGKVLQYAGDSLLAAFGAETAREDDAERAVHAGLGAAGRGPAQAETVRRRHGHGGFKVRVGIHTGHVLLGGGVDAKAASAASPSTSPREWSRRRPPGGLRISQDT